MDFLTKKTPKHTSNKKFFQNLFLGSKWSKCMKKQKRKNRRQSKQHEKEDSRYTSAGVGIFSLGLVTTFVLLFICRYAENRNRQALELVVGTVSISLCIEHLYTDNRYLYTDIDMEIKNHRKMDL